MRISTRGRYGLRIMIELAQAQQDGPTNRTVIAENCDLSAKYIHVLLTSLMSVGLVRSIRGNQGGYILGAPPEKITLLEIVEALEGQISIVDCVIHNTDCKKSDSCVPHKIWVDLNDVITEKLKSHTLAEIAAQNLKDC